MADESPSSPARSNQVLEIVPPGPIHRHRKSVLAKFSLKVPNFKEPGVSFVLQYDNKVQVKSEVQLKKEEAQASRLRPTLPVKQESGKQPMIMEQRFSHGATGGQPAVQVYRGLPEAPGGSAAMQSQAQGGAGPGAGPSASGVAAGNSEPLPVHWVLFKQGGRVTAFPLEQWLAFKPYVDRRAVIEKKEAAEAAAAADAKRSSGFGLPDRFLPKSLRMERQRQDEEQSQMAEQVRNGKLLAKLEDLDMMAMGGGPRLRRTVDEEDDLFGDGRGGFGNDDLDEAFADEGASKRKKGFKKKGIVTADGEALDDDEAPEDVYEGEHDNLRPERPKEAEDWEHEFEPEDDDQDQGADDEVYEDDPGLRKKLGIEADDDEEEEAADETERKLRKLGDPEDDSDKEDEAEEAKPPAGGQPERRAEGEPGSNDDEDVDLDEPDDMDEDEAPPPRSSQPQAVGNKRKAAAPPEPASNAAAEQPAKRARAATPPVPPVAAPPPPRPPAPAVPSPAPAPAAPPPAPRPQSATPPPPAVVAAAAAAGGAGGPPLTQEEVIRLLRAKGGSMKFSEFSAHWPQARTDQELKDQLKRLTVALCASEKRDNMLFVKLRG